MTRSEFIKSGIRAVPGVLLVWLGYGCNPSTSPYGPGGNANQRTFTSSSVQDHAHTIAIQRSEVESPPQGGITRNTSFNGGHTHSFSMTQQQLQNVNAGQNVAIADSVVSDHNHQYQIFKWF